MRNLQTIGRIILSLVSFVQIKNSNMTKATEDSLYLINYEFPKNIQNVVIKPNLCYYWDFTTGQTTDPKFVAAIIDLARARISPNINISIVESDASAMKCKYAFKMLGYERLANNYNVNLINLSEDPYETVHVSAGKYSFKIMVPKTIQEADLKINVPKIKYTMEPIKLTCALKNIFGCNPYPKKFKYHSKLGEAIVAINKAMSFNLHVIDGIVVSGIQPRRLGLVMASTDPVAIDTAAAEIAGINPKKIKYLQLAQREHLGTMTYISKGEPVNQFKAKYPKKRLKNKLISTAYRLAVLTGLDKRLGLG
jgi:uncharacterized protein (DUF362 family)